jgi:dTDP-4-dehydrorhamnose reductase
VKRLLVTGVSGLLGSNLAWLASEQYSVIGVLTGEHVLASPGLAPFQTIVADLSQPGQVERVMDEAQPEIVIHCAAMTDVDRCEVCPEQATRINASLPGMMAKSAAKNKIQLLHISTDAVFDGEQGNYCEEDLPKPINVYSRTKFEGEQIVAEAYPEALIARVNFYGWSWQGRRSLAEWFYNNLGGGRCIPGFTDLIFSPLLVNDMALILLSMLDRRLSGLYHVVSSEFQSKFAFGRMLAREFGFDDELVTPASYLSAGLKAPRPRMLNLRSEKLARVLGADLPAQAPAVRRFVELHRQGYPQSLRAMFIDPNLSAVSA